MSIRSVLARLCCLLLGAFVVLALVGLTLQFLPVSTGMHRTAESARWPLQDTPPRSAYSFSITWAMLETHRGVTNNYGHVAPFDYRKASHPLIVVGDSFVESLMNDYVDTLQGQLGRKIGMPEGVYGLGVSGLSASDYVALSRQARDEFHPVAAIYVISDGDLSESLLRRKGTYYLVPSGVGMDLDYGAPEPRGDGFAANVRQSIADLAIHRYFQINLQFSLDPLLALLGKGGDVDPRGQAHPATLDEQRRVADWFLEALPASLGLPPKCVALLVDTDRYAIYRADLASTRKDLPAARDYLIQRARDLGFAVSDLGPVFDQRYARDHIRFDYFPIDRHWSKVGHGVAAEESYRLLFGGTTPATSPCLTLPDQGVS